MDAFNAQTVVQDLVVAAIVAAALIHASTKYLPAAWRRRIALRFNGNGTRASTIAAWFDPKAAGCGGGCSSCSSDAPSATTPCATDAAKSPSEHVIKFQPHR
jgi:hypothetical protein